MTPAIHALPVSLIPAKLALPVSMTTAKLYIITGQYKTVKASLTGVIDTGEEFLAVVNNTSNAGFTGGIDTGESPK
jgi:hypothetical protein